MRLSPVSAIARFVNLPGGRRRAGTRLPGAFRLAGVAI